MVGDVWATINKMLQEKSKILIRKFGANISCFCYKIYLNS